MRRTIVLVVSALATWSAAEAACPNGSDPISSDCRQSQMRDSSAVAPPIPKAVIPRGVPQPMRSAVFSTDMLPTANNCEPQRYCDKDGKCMKIFKCN